MQRLTPEELEAFLRDNDLVVPNDVADLRKQMLNNGYTPLPADAKGVYLEEWSRIENGKQCGITPTTEIIDGWSVDYPQWASSAVRCGEIVGIDCDVPDATVAELIRTEALR